MNDTACHGILIVSDMDGTFLGEGGKLPPRNAEAVKKFLAHGGSFAVATGRDYGSLYEFIPEADALINAPCIFTSGSVFMDVQGKRCLDRAGLLFSPALRDTYVRWSEAGDDCIFRFDTLEENIRLTQDTTDSLVGRQADRLIHFSHNSPELYRQRAFLEERFGDSLTCFFTSNHQYPLVLEVLPKDVDKGYFFSRYRSYFSDRGEPLSAIYAVGDFYNDIPMFQQADFAACPAGAPADLKSQCSICLCDHKQGAVADLIERIFRSVGVGSPQA